MKFETSKKIDKWVENHRKSGCVSNATVGRKMLKAIFTTQSM